eukprot:contig_18973_g4674
MDTGSAAAGSPAGAGPEAHNRQGDRAVQGGPASGPDVPVDQEEPGAGQSYAVVVGVVPEDFRSETVTAWPREEARGWVTTITVVRHADEVGIQRVATRSICQGPGGVDEAAVRDLDALLALTDQVVSVAGLRARLLASGKRRKDRGSFVRVRLESRDGVWAALVDEDLAPLDLPYSPDVLEGCEILGTQDENADQSDEVVPTGPFGGPGARSSGSAGHRSDPPGGRTVYVANLLDHKDVPDTELMDLEGNLTTTAVL